MDWNLIFLILALVSLFLFGIESFSKEIKEVAKEKLKKILKKATNSKWKSTFFGAIATSIIQSSTATTVITVSLVNAGIISFFQSIGLIFGANIGTTVTAQLISLKLTKFAPVFIVAGFIINFFGWKKTKVFGKPLFYFGLVFFSLDYLSNILASLKDNSLVLKSLSYSDNIFGGILVGFILANIFQSSSVVSGLTIISLQNELIPINSAIFIILGANVGTTTTVLLATLKMNFQAKKTAWAHFMFNFLGVIIAIPFLYPMIGFIEKMSSDPARVVANFHTIFNIVIAFLFLGLHGFFIKSVDLISGLIYKKRITKQK